MTRGLASVLIVIVFVLTLFFVNSTGIASRSYGRVYGITEGGFQAHIVNTPSQAYALWKEKGFRGRVVVHMGRFFGFKPVQYEDIPTDINKFPPIELPVRFDDILNDENFMWVAARNNVAREVVNIVPLDIFESRLRQLKEGGGDAAGVSFSEDKIAVTHLGLKRTMTPFVPDIKEPVLLHIDASYFSSVDVDAAVKALKNSGLRSDMITVSFSVDSADITGDERQRLVRFVSMLSEERR